MSQQLQKRVQALEEQAGAKDENLVWLIRFVAPGEQHEPTAYTCKHPDTDEPWTITRQPGEAVEAFDTRAEREAPRNPQGISTLFATYAE